MTEQYKTVNGESVIDFMEKLRDQHSDMGLINRIVDGAAGYNKSAVVIESAWKVMNEKVRNNRCFHSAKEFRQKIDEFFEKILPDIGDSLDTRINDNFQTFEPALSG